MQEPGADYTAVTFIIIFFIIFITTMTIRECSQKDDCLAAPRQGESVYKNPGHDG